MPQSWRVTRHGEPSQVLRLDEVTRPTLRPGEVEVRVQSASCNFADILLCRGQYQQRPDLPFTPGLEVCGRVTRVGTEGEELLGLRVVGQPVLPHGGFARAAVLRAVDAHPVPAEVDNATAAITHLTPLTAWLGLHRRAALRAGESVVVTAAAGGVGSAAIQIAHAAGATVIAVVSGQDKAAAAARLGAHHVIDRSSQDVIGEIRGLVPHGVDVVFESVGGQSFQQATKYIGFEGRIVVVGFAGGEIPRAALDHTMVKNYTIAGLHWSLYRDHHPNLVREGQQAVFEMLAAGHLTAEISELPFSEVPQALEQLAAGHIRGKAVITVDNDYR